MILAAMSRVTKGPSLFLAEASRHGLGGRRGKLVTTTLRRGVDMQHWLWRLISSRLRLQRVCLRNNTIRPEIRKGGHSLSSSHIVYTVGLHQILSTQQHHHTIGPPLF